jgi:hypothetical protein
MPGAFISIHCAMDVLKISKNRLVKVDFILQAE